MKPKLALLTLDFFPNAGGQQELLFEMSQRLTKAYEVFVITPISGDLPGTARFQRVLLKRRSPLEIYKQLNALRPQKVLLGHTHPRLLVAAATYGDFSTIAHGNDFLAAQKRWHRWGFNWLLSRSKPLITVSKAMASRLVDLGMSEPVIILPGTDPTRFAPNVPFLERSSLRVITVCRLLPRKGVDMVLRALPKLLTEFPDLEYIVAGKGPDLTRLSALAKELQVENSVQFLGFVPDSDLPALYRSCDVFVMPSRVEEAVASIEGFGIVFLEASASGIPVVAGHSGGAVEAVRDGETGYLVNPTNPEELLEILLELLGNIELRQKMGIAGRQWVETEMNWDRAGDQLIEVLKEQKL